MTLPPFERRYLPSHRRGSSSENICRRPGLGLQERGVYNSSGTIVIGVEGRRSEIREMLSCRPCFHHFGRRPLENRAIYFGAAADPAPLRNGDRRPERGEE